MVLYHGTIETSFENMGQCVSIGIFQLMLLFSFLKNKIFVNSKGCQILLSIFSNKWSKEKKPTLLYDSHCHNVNSTLPASIYKRHLKVYVLAIAALYSSWSRDRHVKYLIDIFYHFTLTCYP